MAIMRIGGAATVLALLIGLIPYWFFRRVKSSVPPVKSEIEPATQT
jgi:hypothetical protein